MSETKTVYVVTSGEYSYYGIRGMFTTLQKAEAFVIQFNQYDGDMYPAQIEEWSLDDLQEVVARPAFEAWIKFEDGAIYGERAPMALTLPHQRSMEPESYPTHAKAVSFVSAEHARKLAVEARQKWLATEGATQ